MSKYYTPLPHHIKPLELLKNNSRFFLFLEMGLGKTFLILHHWYHNRDNNLLVVCKPSVINVWESEVNKFFPNIKVNKLNDGSKKASIKLEESLKSGVEKEIFIVSYETSYRLKDAFTKILKKDTDFFTLAFDESQRIKTKSSKRGKFAATHLSKFKSVYLLSGTPISKDFSDWYNQLKVLNIGDKRLDTWTNFKENFLLMESQVIQRNGRRWEFPVIVGVKNEKIFYEILKTNLVRMKLKDSGVQLPEENELTVPIDNTYEVKKILNDEVYNTWKLNNAGSKMSAYQQLGSFFIYGKDLEGNRVIEKLNKDPKRDAFRDLLVQTKDNFIVFYNFEQELETIKEVTEGLERTFAKFDSTQENIPEVNVLAIQYLSGAEGLNLQMYNRTIYYSPTTQGALFIQSKKRTHRIGQEKPCFYYYLITKDSIEERIFEKIKQNEEYTEVMFEQDFLENKG